MVDVYLNGDLLIDDFVFRTATPFIDAPATIDFTVAIAPSNSTSAGDAIYTQVFNLADGGTYVVVASGIVSGSGYNPLQPLASWLSHKVKKPPRCPAIPMCSYCTAPPMRRPLTCMRAVCSA